MANWMMNRELENGGGGGQNVAFYGNWWEESAKNGWTDIIGITLLYSSIYVLVVAKL